MHPARKSNSSLAPAGILAAERRLISESRFTGLIYLRATGGERITARRSTQGARTPVVRSN